jgi:hypothetical protein
MLAIMLPLSSFETAEFNVVVSSQSSLKCVPPTDGTIISEASPRIRSSVTFAPDVSVRTHLHIKEFYKEELHASWYNKRELNLIRSCARCEAKFQRLGILRHHLGSYCTRGLEFRTTDGLQRMKNKIAARQAVLEASSSSDNAECLAQVYSVYSRPCQKAAQDLALQDEKDADI